MRVAIIGMGIWLTFTALASAQLPGPPSQLPAPPMQSSPLQQYQPQETLIRAQATGETITTLSTVQVRQPTVVRSKPNDQAYPCNATLLQGTTVKLLALPKPGDTYAAIEAPSNCYSLVPEKSIFWLSKPKNFLTAPQRIKVVTETLIDGDVGVGMDYVKSGAKLMKETLVDVVDEKKIMVNGKMANYVVIRTSGKEARYVKIADLEGVGEAMRQAQQNEALRQEQLRAQQLQQQQQQQQQQFQFNGNTNPSDSPWADPKQRGSSAELEQLSPVIASQVQQADRSYQDGLRSGAWEDARMRYQQLLESDVMSIRILAKNRLEFIREWQANPPALSGIAQQQAGYLSPTYNHYPWVPGNGAAFRSSVAANTSVPPFGNITTSNPTFGNIPVAPAPVREMVVKPTAPADNTSLPKFNIPTYQDLQPKQPVQQPATAANTATGQPPPTNPQRLPAQTVSQPGKWVGKLHKAVQYQSLYYLTNSQGMLVNYVRGNNVSGPQLAANVGKYVEVEGSVTKVTLDGQQKEQISAVVVRPLR